MKKTTKIIMNLIMILASLGLSYYLLINNLTGYAIIFITLTVILFIILLSSILKKTDEESQYNHELKQILKKYDAILVETSTTPNIEDKNIMLITNIEDMIDASVEIRKPIYYKTSEDNCIFILLDNQDACVYILKLNKEEELPIEAFIKGRKENIENLIDNARSAKLLETNTSLNVIDEKYLKVNTPIEQEIIEENNSTNTIDEEIKNINSPIIESVPKEEQEEFDEII